MTTAERYTFFTYTEYLRALEDSHIKLEYRDGEIFAMAGGTPAHARLSARTTFLLQRAVGDRCAVYSSDAKVLIETADLATFPDGSVVCGPEERAAKDQNALTNPVLVVEVTSNSTERYDREEKLRRYQKLDSLRAVLIVSHRAPRVTVVQRKGTAWLTTEVTTGMVSIDEPQVQFSLEELYAAVVLEP